MELMRSEGEEREYLLYIFICFVSNVIVVSSINVNT